jgi:hypothetical protein
VSIIVEIAALERAVAVNAGFRFDPRGLWREKMSKRADPLVGGQRSFAVSLADSTSRSAAAGCRFDPRKVLASRKGIEPLTPGLGNLCSILLSYRDRGFSICYATTAFPLHGIARMCAPREISHIEN